MALYATGFNAWAQLQFEGAPVEEPDDLTTFTCVLHDDAINNVRSFLSYTLVCSENGQVHLAGMVPKDHEKLRIANKKTYEAFVEASNGIVVAHDITTDTLHQYSSTSHLLSQIPSLSFPSLPSITQLVSHATGFAALTPTGAVYTWCDERYPPCLGRDPTPTHPADLPSPVPDLLNLPTGPITKIAAGGYLLAALTAGRDLYCWGHAGRSTFLEGVSEVPRPVVIGEDEGEGEGKDVADMAVGDAHMIILTTGGEVYVIGENRNGQLGLPGVGSVKTWTRVNVNLEGAIITGLAAGPRSSFLIVRNRTKQNQPGLR